MANGRNNSTVNYFTLKMTVKGKKIEDRRKTNRIFFIRVMKRTDRELLYKYRN